jgi:hypothetical protein
VAVVPDTFNIFQSVRSIADQVKVDWTDGEFGPWLSELNVMAWPLSCRRAASDPIFDYYMVQIEGEVSYQDRGTGWSLSAYGIEVEPLSPMPLSLIDLIDTSPSTTVGATSYTTGITETVGGSIGFFGDQLTASVSASVSMNNSSSRSISDLIIENVSMRDMDPPIKASWRFEVAPGTPMAASNCPINVEFLYRTPHGSGLTFSVVLSVYMTGSSWAGETLRARYLELLHDANNMATRRGAPSAGALTDQQLGDLGLDLRAYFHRPTVQILEPSDFKTDPNLTDAYYQDKSCLRVHKKVTLAAPPPPHSEPTTGESVTD